MRELGFRTLLPDCLQAPIIVTFHMPKDAKFVFQSFYDRLKDRGYVIYPGKLTVADSFRIGCIGRHRCAARCAARWRPSPRFWPSSASSATGSGHERSAARTELRMQERVRKPKLPVKAHEKMRIAGKLVDADERIEVRNPYTGAVVGTVAAASSAQVAEAFKIGNAYKSKLTRYDRQKILTTRPRSWPSGARRSRT